MALIIGRIKCCFCGKKDGVIHSVHAYGIYADDISKRYYYHSECLELVEMYPEQHGHKLIDLAIEISDRKAENIEKTNSKIIPNHVKKIEKLNTNHFERMMPKKC